MMGRFAANSFKALTTNMSYMLTIYSVAGIGLGCLGAFLQLKGFGSIEVFQILVLLILPTHFLTYGTYRLFETQTPPRTNFLRSFSKSKPRTQWERVGQIAVTERLLEKSDLEVVLKTFREQA